jgi:hypothetical protein
MILLLDLFGFPVSFGLSGTDQPIISLTLVFDTEFKEEGIERSLISCLGCLFPLVIPQLQSLVWAEIFIKKKRNDRTIIIDLITFPS